MTSLLDTSRIYAAPSAGGLLAPIEALRVRLARYNRYRTTVRELSDLSDRALADLGLRRNMIRPVARTMVYGD